MPDRLRLLRGLIALLLIGAAAWSVASGWRQTTDLSVEWRFSPRLVLASCVVIAVCYGLLIEGWRRIMIAFRCPLPFLTAARIWLLASLGRYVPGKVWTFALAGALAKEAGSGATEAVSAAVVMQLSALVGAGLLALTLPAVPLLDHAAPSPLVTVLAAGALAVGYLSLGSRRVANRLPRWLPGPLRRALPVPGRVLAMALLFNVLAWVGYGIALNLAGRGVSEQMLVPLRLAAPAFALAHTIGFLALLAPGGLGAREAMLVLLLSESIGGTAALGLSIAIRLLMTVTEFAVLGVTSLALRRSPSRGMDGSGP